MSVEFVKPKLVFAVPICKEDTSGGAPKSAAKRQVPSIPA
jgi:hypothetical protein